MKLSARVSAIAALSLSASTVAESQTDTEWLPGALNPNQSWAALSSAGDVGRGGPTLIPALELVRRAPPRIGMFWSAGNPGSLIGEIDSARVDYSVSGVNESGEFRRPLVPSEVKLITLRATGWRRLGTRGAAIGRVQLRRSGLDGNANHALGFQPYTGSPLVPTDSVSPVLVQSSALLEGGMAWRVAEYEFGGMAGLAVADNRAEKTRIGRQGRAASPSIALGITRHLYGPVRVGIHGRAGMRNERINTIPINADEYVLQLEGLNEVEPIVLAIPQGYYRLFRGRHHAFGLSASSGLWGMTVVGFAERGGLHERHSSATENDPPSDAWITATRTLGGALAGDLLDGVIRAVVEGRYTGLNGDATRHDLDGRIYRAEDHRLQIIGDVRITVPGRDWTAAVRGFMRRDRRMHRDALAELGTEMVTLIGGATAEVERGFVAGGRIAGGYGFAVYTPSSTIPAGETLGPIFQKLIAPELEWYTTPALTHRATLTASLPVGMRTFLWLGLDADRTTPREASPTAFRPTGQRLTTALTVGATLR